MGHRDRSRLEAAERALAIAEAIQIAGDESSEIQHRRGLPTGNPTPQQFREVTQVT
jgi:hypothetical protein